MSDASSPAIRIVHDDSPPTSGRVASLEDKIDALSNQFSSFVVEMREAVKDIATVVRVHHGRGLDTEERATQLERDIVEHRGRLVKLEQAAAKRLKKARTK